jgi:transketolase
MTTANINMQALKNKAAWVRRETLNIHKIAQETRLASSLSPVEIFVSLFYGGIMRYDSKNLQWDERDRLIISKGHGSICFYPILADLGFFDMNELKNVCREGSFLGGIPDATIPGYETMNGSLGHGPGVACGIALALKRRNRNENVFVVLGDGELYEGSVWEAFMFAGEHKLDNLNIILDNNKICMLGYCKNILDMNPLEDKFRAFKWIAESVDGHDLVQLYASMQKMKELKNGSPKILIANTVKGKGIPDLEKDPLSHIRNIKPEDIDKLMEGLA